MLKRRPLLIRLIALLYLLTPFTFILQYIYFSGLSWSDPLLWDKFKSPYMLSFLLIPPVISIGIYRIREWGWFLAILHTLFLIINNSVAMYKGSATPQFAITLFTVATFVVLVVFVRKEVMSPYFNPGIRWWESKPRYAVTLKVKVVNSRVGSEGETYNISETGMFMVSQLKVMLDEKFSITLEMEGHEPVGCEGKVVWLNPVEANSIPPGFGIIFIEPDYSCLDAIRRYVKEQKKILYR